MLLREGWNFAQNELPLNADWRGRSGWDTFKLGAKHGLENSLLFNLVEDQIQRPAWTDPLLRSDPEMRELLSPEQIHAEFPSLKDDETIKNPMLRAEAHYYAWRKARDEKAWGREYTGQLPEWLTKYSGMFAGALSDPTLWATAFGGWGLVSKVPAYRRMLDPLFLATKTAKARGTAAAALGLTTFVEDMIYNVGNYHTSKLVNRPYTTGDIYLNAAIASGLGAGLGGIFPSLGVRQGLALKGNVPVEAIPLAMKAEQLRVKMAKDAPTSFQDKFFQFLKDESGSVDPLSVLRLLEGQADVYDDFVAKVQRGEIKLANRYGDFGKEEYIPSAEREYQARLASRKVNVIEGMSENEARLVTELDGKVFDEPKRRVQRPTGMANEARDRGYYLHANKIGQGGDIPSLYLAFSPGKKDYHVLTNQIGKTAEMFLDRNKDAKEINIIQVGLGQTNVADVRKGVEHLKKFLPVDKYPDAPSWERLSFKRQNEIKQELLRTGKFDGILSGQVGDPLAVVLELSDAGFSKIGRVFSERVRYLVERPKLPSGKVFTIPGRLREIDNIFSETREGTTNLWDRLLGHSDSVGPRLDIYHGDSVLGWGKRPSQDLRQKLDAAGLRPRGRSFSKIVRNLSPNQLKTFKKVMKKEGYSFPRAVRPNTISETTIVLQDADLPPPPKGLSVGDAIFQGHYGSENVPMALRPRSLDLFQHPSLMSALERKISKILVEQYGAKATLDTLNGKTKWAKEYALPAEVSSALDSLNYKKVAWKEEQKFAPRGEGKEIEQPLQDVKKKFESIKGFKRELGEGQEAPKLGEYEKFLAKVFSKEKSKEDFHETLLASLGETLLGRSSKDMHKKVWTRYAKAKEDYLAAPLDTATAKSLLRQLDFEKINIENLYYTAVKIQEGGFDDLSGSGVGAYLQGTEFLALLKGRPDNPYRTAGLENLETMTNTLKQQLIGSALSKIERELTPDEMKLWLSGAYDEYILRDKYFYDKIAEASKQTSGGKVVDEFTEPDAPVAARKAYRIMRRAEENSQKVLTEAGGNRPPTKNYIGTRSYDEWEILGGNMKWRKRLHKGMSQVEYREHRKQLFVESLVNAMEPPANMKAEDFASDFFDSILEKFTGRGKIETVDNVDSLARQIVFKSPEDELAFLQRWGKGGDRSGKWMRWLKSWGEQHTNSPIVNGFFASLEQDAARAAVTKIFGLRPYEGVAFAYNVLRDKYRTKGIYHTERGLEASLRHAETMLDSLLTPVSGGYSAFAQIAKVGRDLTAASVLTHSAIPAAFGDMGASTLVLSKYLPHNNILKATAKAALNRLLVLPKAARQQVANDLHVILSTASQVTGLRYFRDDVAHGWSSWLATTSVRLGFIPYVTDIGKTAQALAVAKDLAAHLTTPFKELPSKSKIVLGQYGIEADEWAILSNIWAANPDVRGNLKGMTYLSFDRLQDHLLLHPSPLAGERISRGLWSYMSDMGTKSIPMQGAYEQAFIGSIAKEPDAPHAVLMKSLLQFKAIAGAVMGVLGDVSRPLTPGGQRAAGWDTASRWKATSAMLGTMLTWGMFIQWTKDLAKGRTPSDMDGEFVWKSIVQSGVLGIVGDFVQNQQGYGGIELSSLIPAWGLADKGFRVAETGIQGLYSETMGDGEFNWDRFYGAAHRLGYSVTPSALGGKMGMNTALLNTFFLSRWNDESAWAKVFYPPPSDRMRRMMEERGQVFFGEL